MLENWLTSLAMLMCLRAGIMSGSKMEPFSLKPVTPSAFLLVVWMEESTHAGPPDLRQQQCLVWKYHKMLLVSKKMLYIFLKNNNIYLICIVAFIQEVLFKKLHILYLQGENVLLLLVNKRDSVTVSSVGPEVFREHFASLLHISCLNRMLRCSMRQGGMARHILLYLNVAEAQAHSRIERRVFCVNGMGLLLA